MEQYIPKSDLVAEIEGLKERYALCPAHNNYEEGLKEGRLIGYIDALDKINSMEVKEVDLNREIQNALPSKYCWSGDGESVYSEQQMCDFAKYFFELGIKAKEERRIV